MGGHGASGGRNAQGDGLLRPRDTQGPRWRTRRDPSPDALGLESPRIVAEVKHRKGAMGAPAVRSFIGGLRAGERGLYVSTGGFTKEARYEADRANVPVRLLDLDSFVRHYVEVYDKTDDEARSILPLTRIWWPA
ncbi:MAG: restriction endonuclease [Collinsella phocaeensis]